MVKGEKIQIRLAKNEYERIKNVAAAKGYSGVSAFIRAVALEKDLFTEKKLIENGANVKKILQLLEQKLD